MEERSIKAFCELMQKCDVALLGAGELTEQSTMRTSGHITRNDVRILRQLSFERQTFVRRYGVSEKN